MKKLLLTLVGVIFMISTLFSQSFIGKDKNYLMDNIKSSSLRIEKSSKDENGYYSITAVFQNNTNQYSFTKDDICYFYIVNEKLYSDNYLACVKYYDERYLRAFDDPCSTGTKTDIWKESKGDTFIYRWIICNYNTGTQYTLFLTKDNYEINKNDYLRTLLGSGK